MDDEDLALSDFEDDDFEDATIVRSQSSVTAGPSQSNPKPRTVFSPNIDPRRQIPPAPPAVSATPRTAEFLELALRNSSSELSAEKEARYAAENSQAIAELALAKCEEEKMAEIMRFKTLAEDMMKQREDIIIEKEQLARERDEVKKLMQVAVKERDLASSCKESVRHDIEEAVSILSAEVAAIHSRIGNKDGEIFKQPIQTQELGPTVQALRRTIDTVVEEAFRTRDETLREMESLKEEFEKQRVEKATEVSGLEATIAKLRYQLEEKIMKVETEKVVQAEGEANAISMQAATLEKELRDLQCQSEQQKCLLESYREELEKQTKSFQEEQGKLLEATQCCSELKEQATCLQEEVMKLQSYLTDAEEETARWRAAAVEEATAGAAVMEEFEQATQKLRAQQNEALQWRRTAEDAMAKIMYKVETAKAAMGARDAAELSLQKADLRVAQLQKRLDELANNAEEGMNAREAQEEIQPGCYQSLWQWSSILHLLGGRGGPAFVDRTPLHRVAAQGATRSSPHHLSAEMEELMQPLV